MCRAGTPALATCSIKMVLFPTSDVWGIPRSRLGSLGETIGYSQGSNTQRPPPFRLSASGVHRQAREAQVRMRKLRNLLVEGIRVNSARGIVISETSHGLKPGDFGGLWKAPTPYVARKGDTPVVFPATLRVFNQEYLVQAPIDIVAGILQRTLDHFNLRHGDELVAMVDDGVIVDVIEINGRRLSPADKKAPLSPTKPWTQEKSTMERLLPVTTPWGKLLQCLYPITLGAAVQLVGKAGAGKTTAIKLIKQSLDRTKVKIIHLQIGERPYEVARSEEGVEVFASTSRQTPTEAHMVADLAYARAMRLAESGHHVVMLVDSLYRVAVADAQAIDAGKTGGYSQAGVSTEVIDRVARERASIAGYRKRTTQPPPEIDVIADPFALPVRDMWDDSASITLVLSMLDQQDIKLSQLFLQQTEGAVDVRLTMQGGISRPIWPFALQGSFSRHVGNNEIFDDSQAGMIEELQLWLRAQVRKHYLAAMAAAQKDQRQANAGSYIENSVREDAREQSIRSLQSDMRRLLNVVEAAGTYLSGTLPYLWLQVSEEGQRALSVQGNVRVPELLFADNEVQQPFRFELQLQEARRAEELELRATMPEVFAFEALQAEQELAAMQAAEPSLKPFDFGETLADVVETTPEAVIPEPAVALPQAAPEPVAPAPAEVEQAQIAEPVMATTPPVSTGTTIFERALNTRDYVVAQLGEPDLLDMLLKQAGVEKTPKQPVQETTPTAPPAPAAAPQWVDPAEIDRLAQAGLANMQEELEEIRRRREAGDPISFAA